VAATAAGPVRLGFEDDAEYLGGAWKRLVERSLAVPADVRWVPDVATFRYVTLLFLLAAEDLSLVSVWHPSFLTLLLEDLPRHWEALLADLDRGVLRPPAPLPAGVADRLARLLRPRRRRAAALRAADPHVPRSVWPRLSLVSCWGDGHSALYVSELTRVLPDVAVQPKGLLATEACVTIPFGGASPLAIRSHFFEFLDDAGRSALAHELDVGSVYSVVVTTGGGLYRYRLEDRVLCAGFVGKTPSLRFLGKEGHVSDLCGEKLREDFVAGALARTFARSGVAVRFALLAPESRERPPSYTLYLEADGMLPLALAEALDAELAVHGDYDYARRLGQLAPPRLFRVRGDAQAAFLRRCQERGQRLGNVKALSLSPADWSGVFAGGYEAAPSSLEASGR
jgi:hypothetical protein